MVFRINENPDRTINKYKARLVAKGFHQRQGCDYSKTFSPVVKPVKVRIILTLAISNQWAIQQIDVNNAFLNGYPVEDVYMAQPLGFEATDQNLVCKLQKAIYGLKQAPRAWYERLAKTLMGFGFVQSKCVPSLMILKTKTYCMYILIYVDDIIITGTSSQLIESLITKLNAVFALKQLGNLDYILGIEVKHLPNGALLLSQSKYI